MSYITEGSTVSLEFTGRLSSGEVFGEATKDKPLSFNVGEHQMIAGVEEAVIGMSPGERKTTVIPPEKAFGRRSEERVISVDHEQMPTDFKEGVDDQVQLKAKDGTMIAAQVVDMSGPKVVLDANHPLAGEVLTVDLRVLAVD